MIMLMNGQVKCGQSYCNVERLMLLKIAFSDSRLRHLCYERCK